MTRARRPRERAPDIDAVAWALLTDQPPPEDDGAGGWKLYCLEYGGCITPSLETLWREHGAPIVEEWATERPGTRPSCWWKWSAPRATPEMLGGEIANVSAPRLRLGGIGTPAYEVTATAPLFHLGLPVGWVSRFDAEYYNGRAVDVHGNPIGTEYREGHFRGVPIDPDDPPLYESQAAFLKRWSLLLPGEARRLSPDDFEPVRLLSPGD